MTLPLSPEIMEGAYEFLKTTPPFRRWKLPDSDQVTFIVSLNKAEFGHYRKYKYIDEHIISASARSIGLTDTLLNLMAHEMIHMHLKRIGKASKSGDSRIHNAAFRKFAAQVCRYHGFDPKAFC